MPDGRVTLLRPRRFLCAPTASTVHSPPKRLDFSTQNVEKVSIPLLSEGGASLKIIIRLVHVYKRTSNQPFDVIIAPDKHNRARDGGWPDMEAIRAEARGMVHTTYTSG